ncbi:MAG: AmmeMemoRadiSam system protein B [Candidatus Loosdrechtia sp.]|uniref:AmmeMemoRadiSam system protein B n=1 Tax=Candidatus Loosdrechtia sp. TaxID=3101272 RepID=UPI003A78D9EF|nr:MAG: AmmeMemoRadiSam system protein B [Candidatus Jettenia sp. AMX2]
MIRKPVAAGSFYRSDALQLRNDIEGLVSKDCERRAALGVVAPHAGYVYSGRVAGCLYSKIVIPDTVVILSPNHTGMGSAYSIWPGGSWITPLGEVKVNEDVVYGLVQDCGLIEKDQDAHLDEHAAEVQLPFLQYFNPRVRIVVMVLSCRNIADIRAIGKSLSSVLQKSCPDALVVASSDMTHYESQVSVKRKDTIAIDEILALNEDNLYKKVTGMSITMCGIYPVIAMMVCSRERGAEKAELLRYGTSGDVSGDYEHVVGYAGIMIS